MARITVLGGTGYAGAAIVAEAARRGHEVTAVSRNGTSSPVAAVEYVRGSALDASVLDAVLVGRDVVVCALSPRGDMAGKLEGIVDELVRRLDGTSTRLGYIGGASSLLVEPGGSRLWDVTQAQLPEAVRPEIETGLHVLDALRQAPASLDWFYVSPPQEFGARLQTPSRGTYRLGGDVLLRDAVGKSTISAADLALAILDEIERPAHHRARFTAAY